jgi:hypothetical protein
LVLKNTWVLDVIWASYCFFSFLFLFLFFFYKLGAT